MEVDANMAKDAYTSAATQDAVAAVKEVDAMEMDSGAPLIADPESFMVDTRTFERGMFPIPPQLALGNYKLTYKALMHAAYKYKSKSAPMFLFGSTIMGTGAKYQFSKPDGKNGMLPRLNTASRPGTNGATMMQQTWLIEMAQNAERLAREYAARHDTGLIAVLDEAKRIIPAELRIADTCFTALALVGDLKPGDNHPHVDDHDIISLFTTVGDSDVMGGRTLYYNGGSAFDKKHPASTCGEVIAETPFKHGQYQVGPFESVVHGGERWTGHRGVLSFYLNEGILKHFRTYGTAHYDEARGRMYE